MNLTLVECAQAYNVVSQQAIAGALSVENAATLHGVITDTRRELFRRKTLEFSQMTLTRVHEPSEAIGEIIDVEPLEIEAPKKRHLAVRTPR